MASAIHHGAPGSYKSFSVVQRFGIQALLDGRTVISNVRGFDSLDRIKDVFIDLDFPESARLIFIDTSTQLARGYFAVWYKWIPFRAMVLIDEAQTIYPDRADFKLEHLDRIEIPPDFFAIEELDEGRPPDVFTAFDKQRHYQWDIFLTTTNIAKIKRDIRESSEWAYRHRSLSEISRFFKGQWYEHQHDPETNGKADTHRVGKPKKYKADARIFECYQSTATGEHTASQAGTKLFDDAGIKSKLAVVLLAVFAAVGLFAYKLAQSSTTPTTATATNATPVVSSVALQNNQPVSSLPAKNDTVFTGNLANIKVLDTADNLSKVWRVTGYVSGKKGKTIFVIADTNGHTKMISTGCAFDAFRQVSCVLGAEIITEQSGNYLAVDNHVKLASNHD